MAGSIHKSLKGLVIEEVCFDEEEHEYSARGVSLNGITQIVGWATHKHYGDFMPTEACEYGTKVHKIVSKAIQKRKLPHNEDARWVLEELMKGYEKGVPIKTEWLVSDLQQLASCIDIAVQVDKNLYDLYDIKTGQYDMAYCALQLGFYKWMLKISRGADTRNCGVLSSKYKILFPVTPSKETVVQSLAERYAKEVGFGRVR